MHRIRRGERGTCASEFLEKSSLALAFLAPWPPGWRLAGLISLILLISTGVQAQEVRIEVGRGPHYVGESVEVQVIASDFDEDPTPEITPGDLDGGRLSYAGVSDSRSTSISIVNGRMSRVSEVHFVYRFAFEASREGRVRLPAFAVTQGTTKRTTRPVDLQITPVPRTGLVSLSLDLPDGPVFVGQKVPVEVEFRIDREAQRDLLSYTATVPLFDLPNLRFIDEPSAEADTQLEIETQAGTLRLPAVSTEEEMGGRRLLVLRGKRTMIALSPDEIRAEAPRVVINRGSRFRRDLFNQRQPTSSERLMAMGDPVRIEVVEVPRAGRPASFAGAVGEGFSLEVSADRSVVQLGEPILLSFLLRGSGDLSSAGLPPLDAEGLFDPSRFRLPEDPPPGLVSEDGKQFEASLRVLDAEVREIPAIAYSWFDAKTRAFETTYSRPIALSVGAAEIIGADDVARRAGSVDAPTSSEARSEPREDEPVRSTSLVFSGANLAVDDDVARVLGSGSQDLGLPVAVPALYLLGFGLFAFGVIDRRRQQVDPQSLVRNRALRRAENEIEAAAKASGGDAAGALGRSLRELVATLPEEADSEFDGLIAECDSLRFAPVETAGGLPSALLDRARLFVSRRIGARASSGEEAE
jgi:hypothetical protein